MYDGYWEFPGGKVEAGETLHQALVRELHEELGITVDQAWPWLSCQFTYPHATVRLKFFRISDWHGEISPIEHSGFIWTRIGSAPGVTPILPANGPILRALELPPTMPLPMPAKTAWMLSLNASPMPLPVACASSRFATSSYRSPNAIVWHRPPWRLPHPIPTPAC